MNNLKLFIPITKVDSQKRIVYGLVSEEATDKSGEILDYQSAKPAFQKWSDDQFKASGGKSKGNLRAMHGSVAVGIITDLGFDDVAKQVHASAHVVDDNEWKKVTTGTYTGFSIGGAYAKKWADPANPKVQRYTPTLAEVSLVDNPCVHSATFEYIKNDGSTELRKFNTNQEAPMTDDTQTEDLKKEATAAAETETAAAEGVTEAGAVEKAAEEQAVKKAERPQDKGGVEQGFRAKDGSFHLKKADALKRNEALEVEAVSQPALDALKNLAEAITKAESGVKKDEATEAQPEKEPEAEKAAEAEAQAADPAIAAAEKSADATGVKKGMYTVSNFAELLQSILRLQLDTQWEAEWEADGSELPAKLKTWLADGGSLLVQMVGEETAELTASKAAGAADLAKKGAKISAATKEHIDAMHKSASDHMAVMDERVGALGTGGDAQKSDKGEVEKLTKAADIAAVAENDALKKTLGDMVPQINALVKRVEELESQPMPSRGVLRAVAKAEDGGNVSDGDAEKKAAELLKSMTPDQVNLVLMKSALAKPRLV